MLENLTSPLDEQNELSYNGEQKGAFRERKGITEITSSLSDWQCDEIDRFDSAPNSLL